MKPVRPLKGEMDTASKIEAPLPFVSREPYGGGVHSGPLQYRVRE